MPEGVFGKGQCVKAINHCSPVQYSAFLMIWCCTLVLFYNRLKGMMSSFYGPNFMTLKSIVDLITDDVI